MGVGGQRKEGVFVSHCCFNKLHKQWLKTTQIAYPAVLEGRSLTWIVLSLYQDVSRVVFLSRNTRGESVSLPFPASRSCFHFWLPPPLTPAMVGEVRLTLHLPLTPRSPPPSTCKDPVITLDLPGWCRLPSIVRSAD